MKKDAVVVLTSKAIETMAAEGGSGNWRAKASRLRRCKWLIAVRNRHSHWYEGNEEHGSAFLIGKIVGVKESPKAEHGRFVIIFDSYAEISKRCCWPKGHRNPVRYAPFAEFNINVDKLKWKKLAGALADNGNEKKAGKNLQPPAALLEKAKLMIAESLSLPPVAITISIQL